MMSILRLQDKLKNGFINCHAHIDRAGTADFFSKKEQQQHLFDKWKLVKKIKQTSSMEDYYHRILRACLAQRDFGVTKLISFIDLDETTGTRALDAAVEVRKKVKNLGLEWYIGNQTVGGFTNENYRLFKNNIHNLDFLGGLPKSDKDWSRHIDILFDYALQTKKKVHVHVDQMNIDDELETLMLANRTIEAGLEGQVVAVHSISVACHEEPVRELIYSRCKNAGMQFVSCPSAWIDHPRTERMSPTHNSITPIDEMLKWGLTVGIGTDNIEDVYKPYCDGDMMFELRLALEACKVYDDEQLVNLAYNNGLKILG